MKVVKAKLLCGIGGPAATLLIFAISMPVLSNWPQSRWSVLAYMKVAGETWPQSHPCEATSPGGPYTP